MGGVLMRLKYVQPTSLTWWTGVGSVTLGILMVVDNDPWVVELASVVTLLTGGMDASPAQLIGMGLGLIGIRDKLEAMGRA